MKDFIVAGLGEVLFDVLPEGEQIGGAPMNFAYHAHSLGATGIPVSTVGDDARGERAVAELEQRGLATSAISVAQGYATGYVQADVDGQGVARYTFPDDIAWDHLRLNDRAMEVAAKAHAVCFGTLVQRGPESMAAVHRFLDAARPDTLKIFDVNLRQDFYSRQVISRSLEYAGVLKLSDQELPVLARMFDMSGPDSDLLKQMVDKFGLDLAVLTRGESGSLLVSPGGHDDHPGIRTRVQDTIGAGDSFTAAVALGLLKKLPLDIINGKANQLAAYVCACPGAMPPLPDGAVSWL